MGLSYTVVFHGKMAPTKFIPDAFCTDPMVTALKLSLGLWIVWKEPYVFGIPYLLAIRIRIGNIRLPVLWVTTSEPVSVPKLTQKMRTKMNIGDWKSIVQESLLDVGLNVSVDLCKWQDSDALLILNQFVVVPTLATLDQFSVVRVAYDLLQTDPNTQVGILRLNVDMSEAIGAVVFEIASENLKAQLQAYEVG